MKKLILFILLCPLLAQAATYTACWDPVIPAEHYDGLVYMVCVDSTDPSTLNPSPPLECAGLPYFTPYTNIDFQSTGNAWVRSRAIIWDLTPAGAQTNVRWGPYSQTQQIIAGITPPVIGCGCP